MTEYQVLARRYRPQLFQDVVGQEAIVTTLKNAMKQHRVAHAYLFSGPRGTGKTTLARLFAKALNCPNLTSEGEPCNHCSSCKEIAAGSSLDVLEIDGASNRGIEEIRQIKETVGYSSSTGSYRVYIIDEVHMLTKEAFNALLKTLEEPPPKVKFFFATTEPHKVLPTILSRCQRFDLKRISDTKIVTKLTQIGQEIGVTIDQEALRMIAARAGGGLRDAESLMDQLLAFHEGKITTEVVSSILGMMPQQAFFTFDHAGKEGNLAAAFELAHQLFTEGKDLNHFLESLIEHFRTLLLCKLGNQATLTTFSEEEKIQYESSAKLYNQEQCLTILDMLIEGYGQIKLMPSPRIALEALLLKVIRSHKRLPIEFLVRRLAELEQSVGSTSNASSSAAPLPQPQAPKPATPTPTPLASTPVPLPVAPVVHIAPPTPIVPIPAKTVPPISVTVSEDPTPTAADLGQKRKAAPAKAVAQLSPVAVQAVPEYKAPEIVTAPLDKAAIIKRQSRYDTILQFAAVELDGKVEKK